MTFRPHSSGNILLAMNRLVGGPGRVYHATDACEDGPRTRVQPPAMWKPNGHLVGISAMLQYANSGIPQHAKCKLRIPGPVADVRLRNRTPGPRRVFPDESDVCLLQSSLDRVNGGLRKPRSETFSKSTIFDSPILLPQASAAFTGTMAARP
jgi:hypothetical protein